MPEYTLMDEVIYGIHNTVSTIEQVYVVPLKEQIKIWGHICDIDNRKDYKEEHARLCNILDFYKQHKYLLGGQ